MGMGDFPSFRTRDFIHHWMGAGKTPLSLVLD
jgi:hypothetical protein